MSSRIYGTPLHHVSGEKEDNYDYYYYSYYDYHHYYYHDYYYYY